MSERLDPLDTEKTILNLEDSLGDMPTMRPDGEVIGRVDRYELLEKLGEGGFGAVYGAHDTESGVLVALKSLPAEISHDAEEMAEIRDNFALVSRLHHPSIASVLHLHRVEYADEKSQSALGVRENDYLVVMEYAPGATLFATRRALPERKMELVQALDICRPIAEALDYAHSRKVLHRDIKPKNVMVGGQALDLRPEAMGKDAPPKAQSLEPRASVKVLDFGLAAEIRSSMSRKSKEPQDSKSGTPLYMAPEQWAGRRQGPPTDQYALAVMFYELIGGEVPFKSAFDSGSFEIMRNVVLKEPIDPLNELDKNRNAVLLRALAKNPEERFGSCGDFVGALGGGRVSKPRNTQMGASKRSTPRKWVVGLLFAGVAIGGALFGLRLVGNAMEKHEQRVAETRAQVEVLLREASTALDMDNLEVATKKAEAILKLDRNSSDGQGILAEIAKKDRERRSRETEANAAKVRKQQQSDVQLADVELKRLKKTLDERCDDLAKYGGDEWAVAETQFRKAQRSNVPNDVRESCRSVESVAQRILAKVDALSEAKRQFEVAWGKNKGDLEKFLPDEYTRLNHKVGQLGTESDPVAAKREYGQLSADLQSAMAGLSGVLEAKAEFQESWSAGSSDLKNFWSAKYSQLNKEAEGLERLSDPAKAENGYRQLLKKLNTAHDEIQASLKHDAGFFAHVDRQTCSQTEVDSARKFAISTRYHGKNAQGIFEAGAYMAILSQKATEYANSIKLLEKNFPGSSLSAEIARQDFKADCTKCNGSGKVLVSCTKCSGKGVCRACNGSGLVKSLSSNLFAPSRCAKCSQTGRCRDCGGTGSQESACKYCRGKGRVVSPDLRDRYFKSKLAEIVRKSGVKP